MHCEHSVHVRERIAELAAKANELERERDEARKRVAALERERDHANMVADAVVAHVKELEAHRVPNPGVVGTLQDKNRLLGYKDEQIARLQDRVKELEALLGLSAPWPLLDVLERLQAAVLHLQGDHSCDRDGYELDRAALEASALYVEKVRGVVAASDKDSDSERKD